MKTKGKRSEGAIDKDLQKLIADLTLSQKGDHPQYGYQVNIYVNDVSSKMILDLLRILFCRIQPSDKPEALLRFINELTVGDMEEMRKIFGEDGPLCDWQFWKDMCLKTGRKPNGDLHAAIDLTVEKEKVVEKSPK
jgi:hypothetical protein